MLSDETQKLINKKWPRIEDNKILLEFVRQELLKYAYGVEWSWRFDYACPQDTPEEAKKNFYKRARFKNRFLLFAAILNVIAAVSDVVFHLSRSGLAYRYLYTWPVMLLVVAGILYLYYREKRKLMTCYDELKSEVEESAEQGAS